MFQSSRVPSSTQLVPSEVHVKNVVNPMSLCKVAGGTSIIHTSLESFLPKTVATAVLIDCHAYDAWPGLATLEASKGDPKVL